MAMPLRAGKDGGYEAELRTRRMQPEQLTRQIEEGCWLVPHNDPSMDQATMRNADHNDAISLLREIQEQPFRLLKETRSLGHQLGAIADRHGQEKALERGISSEGRFILHWNFQGGVSSQGVKAPNLRFRKDDLPACFFEDDRRGHVVELMPGESLLQADMNLT